LGTLLRVPTLVGPVTGRALLPNLTKGPAMAERTCPPCDGRCWQGRDCPANEPADSTEGGPLLRAFDKAWLTVGLTLLGWIFICLVAGLGWSVWKAVAS
jgi:hypothetical protein